MAHKYISALLAASFAFCAFVASAAIPVRWTTDTYKVKPLVYECYHGETLDLASALTAYGEPLNLSGKTARLYWQTNGMDSAWWQTNAVVRAEAGSTNILAATFSGAYDTGANETIGFIGVEGENYRAAFTLRFRASPGFTPSTLPTPTKKINWAAVENDNIDAAPFVVKGGEGGITASQVTNISSRVTSNIVTKAYVESLGISTGADTNSVNSLIRSYDETNLTARINVKQDMIADYTTTNDVGNIATNVLSGILEQYTYTFVEPKRDYADMTASTNWTFKGWTEYGYTDPLFVKNELHQGRTTWQLWCLIDGSMTKIAEVHNRYIDDLQIVFNTTLGVEVIARRCSIEPDDMLATVKTVMHGTVTPTAATNAAQDVVNVNIATNNLCTVSSAHEMTTTASSAATNYTDAVFGSVTFNTNIIMRVDNRELSILDGRAASSGEIYRSTPSAPVTSSVLTFKKDGTAIIVSVPSSGSLSAITSGWTLCQPQIAVITIASGATISPNISLVGYGVWPTDVPFLAQCVFVNSKVYVTPIFTITQ